MCCSLDPVQQQVFSKTSHARRSRVHPLHLGRLDETEKKEPLMRRFAVHAVTAIALSSLAVLIPAPNASATVHEIVGQWCAGRGELFPPGLSGRSSADNFAKPLFATGVIESITPYLDGVLISFDFDHPAIKLVSTGQIVQIGPGTYVTEFELDPEFAAFTHCPNLA